MSLILFSTVKLLIQCGIHVNYYYKVVMGVDKSIAKVSRLWFVTRQIYVVEKSLGADAFH